MKRIVLFLMLFSMNAFAYLPCPSTEGTKCYNGLGARCVTGNQGSGYTQCQCQKAYKDGVEQGYGINYCGNALSAAPVKVDGAIKSKRSDRK